MDDGWMMDGWMDGCTCRWIDGQTDACMWMEDWTDGWTGRIEYNVNYLS